MSELLQTIKLTNNKVLRIYQDEDPQSPHFWDNEDMFLVYDHRQFHVQKDGFEPHDIYLHTQRIPEDDEIPSYDNATYAKYHILPVYATIHSGVSLSLHPSSGFDVSMKGYIMVYDTQQGFETAAELAQGLINDWNTYLSGDVYRFDLVTLETCKCCGYTHYNIELSIGGFYGSDVNKNGMLDHITEKPIKN